MTLFIDDASSHDAEVGFRSCVGCAIANLSLCDGNVDYSLEKLQKVKKI